MKRIAEFKSGENCKCKTGHFLALPRAESVEKLVEVTRVRVQWL